MSKILRYLAVACSVLSSLLIWYLTASVIMYAAVPAILASFDLVDHAAMGTTAVLALVWFVQGLVATIPALIAGLSISGMSRWRLHLRPTEAATVCVIFIVAVVSWSFLMDGVILNALGAAIFITSVALTFRTPDGLTRRWSGLRPSV